MLEKIVIKIIVISSNNNMKGKMTLKINGDLRSKEKLATNTG